MFLARNDSGSSRTVVTKFQEQRGLHLNVRHDFVISHLKASRMGQKDLRTSYGHLLCDPYTWQQARRLHIPDALRHRQTKIPNQIEPPLRLPQMPTAKSYV